MTKKIEFKLKDARELAETLSGAYSTDRYKGGWLGCIRMLRKRGYDDREVEAIIRSKFTRWAGDASKNAYGRCTSKDLERFLDGLGQSELSQVRELVEQTFALKEDAK